MYEELTEENIKFVSSNWNRWNDSIHTPTPRFPIMAIVRIGSGWGDDMDIGDEGMEESIQCDLGKSVPVCGTSFDGGSGEWFITPDCVRAAYASGLTFIAWERVQKWRYLSMDEASEHWNALIEEGKALNGNGAPENED